MCIYMWYDRRITTNISTPGRSWHLLIIATIFPFRIDGRIISISMTIGSFIPIYHCEIYIVIEFIKIRFVGVECFCGCGCGCDCAWDLVELVSFGLWILFYFFGILGLFFLYNPRLKSILLNPTKIILTLPITNIITIIQITKSINLTLQRTLMMRLYKSILT